MLTPEQLARLSKTAQRHIATLEMRVAELSARLSVGREDSDTFAEVYAHVPRPLGNATTVAFGCVPPTEGYVRPTFTVRMDGDKLYVNCSTGLVAIEPQSSNSFHVSVR